MIRDILVHLDGSREDEVRLAHAEALGLEHQAVLTGLFTLVLPAFGALSTNPHASSVAGYEAALRSDCDTAIERLRHRIRHTGKTTDLRRLEGTIGNVEMRVAHETRRADLFVGTCPYRLDDARWDAMTEAVMLEGGRSLYLVPPDCPVPRSLGSVLVAWRDTRECTRAMAEAIPILAKAERTTLAFVADAEGSRGVPAGTMTHVAAHLARHGAKVGLQTLDGSRGTVAELLLEEARRISADCIVFGAYGHSRFKEWLAGGTTRDLMSRTHLPVLVAH